LFDAVELGEIETVKRIIGENCSLLSTSNEKLQTPLHLALKFGRLDTAKFFLQQKADVKLADLFGKTALHLLAGLSPPVSLAHSSEEEERYQSMCGQLFLMMLPPSGEGSGTEMLNLPISETLDTPLHCAASSCNPFLVYLLAKKKAKIDPINRFTHSLPIPIRPSLSPTLLPVSPTPLFSLFSHPLHVDIHRHTPFSLVSSLSLSPSPFLLSLAHTLISSFFLTPSHTLSFTVIFFS